MFRFSLIYSRKNISHELKTDRGSLSYQDLRHQFSFFPGVLGEEKGGMGVQSGRHWGIPIAAGFEMLVLPIQKHSKVRLQILLLLCWLFSIFHIGTGLHHLLFIWRHRSFSSSSTLGSPSIKADQMWVLTNRARASESQHAGTRTRIR